MARRASSGKKATRARSSRATSTRKKAARKKSTSKKTTRKKAVQKKTARKKTSSSRGVSKRATKKKTQRKSATRKKTTRKKSPTKRATTKKTTARKTTARKAAPRKKTSSKKTPSRKKATRKKTSARASRAGRTRTTRVKAPARPSPSKAPARAHPHIYYFGKRCDGDASMRDALGGKGANLAEMRILGLPVPPGFTIGTLACEEFREAGETLPEELIDGVRASIKRLERETGKRFGGDSDPLLVSVRSGAAISMPGMMDTILNLGLNDGAARALGSATGNRRFAWDAFRRLIQMFGSVVMGVPHDLFEEAFDVIKQRFDVTADADVPAHGMQVLCEMYQDVYERHTDEQFPQDPYEQLRLAIKAVFKSWMTPRAVRYRQINEITGLRGTAVNVQTMVFGNMGNDSATGVAFTRNPSTGEKEFFGEFLINAQGEDVVAGIRTPKPISQLHAWNSDVYEQLDDVRTKLEKHYADVQDIEFTIERGTLWMLQTRSGKRTAQAAIRIATDMAGENLISKERAIASVDPDALTQLLLPSFDHDARKHANILTTGLPASPGVAVGKPAFSVDDAVARSEEGQSVILVRKETSPEDIDGMHSAVGILTSTGGMTSHAAVVARGWGKCCVVGAKSVAIDVEGASFQIGDRRVSSDDVISLDGSTGDVISGAIPTVEPELSSEFTTIMEWADTIRTMRVRTNTDTPQDARRAREYGAEGIGLCRTEHMFFEESRIAQMRRMILAEDSEHRSEALEALLPHQRGDFVQIFEAMHELPVTIRLLDPPLHEFLPHDAETMKQASRDLGVSPETLRSRVRQLREQNPMLGHRGCRLAVTYPEILRMQVRAIIEATIECARNDIVAIPEIMVPLVSTSRELAFLRPIIEDTIERVCNEQDACIANEVLIGTMIEIPRAALVADTIAPHADFFSFGTNDLTQMTYGFSRDDIGAFLPDYLDNSILERDPFQSLDESGVAQLIEIACKKARKVNPRLKLGICGEHGGDPQSIHICQSFGLDYVSCSPFRVPIARLAAAQASAAKKS
ncbi:MAG: pyruvate, phosphate dikinase [Phycisphaerales bacterium JB043]